jgi:hypothetical protein
LWWQVVIDNFDFSLSYGLPPSEKELRLFKSLTAYINALSRFCLGEKEFEEGKLLSATVNLYYSLFHLGVATLVAHEKYDFVFENEFLLPDGSNIGRVKRITNLSHKRLIGELQKCGKSSAFVKELSKALEESIHLREFFSYGPYVQMFNKRKEDGFLVVMLFLPASFADEFGASKNARNKRSPIKERIERAIIENRNLISQYPAFVRKVIEKLDATEKVEIQPLFFSLSANLFIYLSPYFPEFIFKRIEKLTQTFCESLGHEYFEMYHRGKNFFNKEGFLESVKKGEIIQAIELRIPEKYFAQFSTKNS